MTWWKLPQCVYFLSVILFLLCKVREDDITPNIARGVDLRCDIFPHIQPGPGSYYPQYHRGVYPLVILFLISWDGEDDSSGNMAGVLHTHCAIVPNNMIWLPVSQRSYILLWYCFLYSRGENDITPIIAGVVHTSCDIVPNILKRRA